MTKSVAITQSWAQYGLDTSTALSLLQQQLNQLDKLPTHIRVVSAGECCIFLNATITAFCQQLQQNAQVTFISAACTSVHAALLDFYHSDENHGLIITLELDQQRQQNCLDALDIGINTLTTGLNVTASCGFIEIMRSNDNGEKNDLLHIDDCQILSQKAGLNGTPELVSRLCELLKDNQGHQVSFAISSKWGMSLLNGVNTKFAPNWLASVETGQDHYLSVKPLLELQQYRHHIKQRPVLFITLGGGGRVGILRLNNINGATKPLPTATYESHNINSDIDGFTTAEHLKNTAIADCYQQIRQTLKYPRSRYRGIDNHYFVWSLPSH